MKGLQQKAPFDSLEPDKLRRIAIAMSLRQAKGGEVVVKEGEKGDECFLVEAGEHKVSVGGKEVDTVATGALFGELAVLYNVPRTASVTAASDVSLWCLHRTTFQRLLRVVQHRARQGCGLEHRQMAEDDHPIATRDRRA